MGGVICLGISNDSELDGIEYRFIKEVARNWKINFDRRPLDKDRDLYEEMYVKVNNRSSDVVMCSVWINERHHQMVALSTYFDWQCVTFLVPIPTKIPEATIIYRTLSATSWAAFLSAFFLTGLSLTFVARLQSNSIACRANRSIVNCFLDLVNIATAQGLNQMPKSHLLRVILLR